ncbi:hypothetical protein [Gordonia phage MerCougar]|nr:hypothetical protein [Gordonia phage MerCougar]
MAHDAPFPKNPMRPAAEERAFAINLVSDALVDAMADARVNTDGLFNPYDVAEKIVDSPKLLVLSDNWLKDHEIASIMQSIRNAKVEVTTWNTGSSDPTVAQTVVTVDELDRLNLELARLTRRNDDLIGTGRRLRAQIDNLGQWIIDNVDGEPSRSEGAVDTAIRVMRRLIEERNEHQVNTRKIERLSEWISKNIPGENQDWTGNPVDTVIKNMVKADGRIHALRDQIEEMRAKRNHLAQWMTGNLPASIVAKESSIIDAAIKAMDELQRELKAERETTREEEDIPKPKLRKADEARIQASRKLVDDINEQTRRLAGMSKIPPQLVDPEAYNSGRGEYIHTAPGSIEDAKREAIKTRSRPKNRFGGVWSAETLLAELAGAASKCWERVEDAGVFDSTEAKKIVDEAISQLKAISLMQAKNRLPLPEESHEDRQSVAEANARNEAIWTTEVGNDPTKSAKAFIDGRQRVHVLNEPDHGAVTNDLLKRVIERIDKMTQTVVQLAGAPRAELAYYQGKSEDGPTPAAGDVSRGKETDTWQGAISKALTPPGATTVINYSLDGAAVKITQLMHDSANYQDWRQKISRVLGATPGQRNYDLDTAVNKIGELRKDRKGRATGDEWRAAIAAALGRTEEGASLGLAEATTSIRDLRQAVQD